MLATNPFFYLFIISLVVILLMVFIWVRLRKKMDSLVAAFESVWKIQSVVLSTLDFEEMVKKIANTILIELDYMKLGYIIVVLALVDEQKQVLRRIGLSETQEAQAFLKRYPKPYRTIEIPLSDERNLAIKAMKEKRMKITHNVADVLYPAVDANFVSTLQKEVGVKSSIVYPVSSRDKILGVLIFSLKKNESKISEVEWSVMRNFVGAAGIAIENAKLFQALKVSNQALHFANVKLGQLDKLKDDFVSIASHELRTPMTAIKSYLWMALKRSDVKLTEKMSRYLSRAYISTERLINLVNDMLNVSRIEAGRIEINPVSFNMLSLVDDVIAEVAAKAQEKMIHLQVFKAQIPQAFADSDKVHQVLLNLIGNALKFTPTDGTITVSFFSDGKVLEVSVKDSGVGINKDDLTKLFKKFERLDNSYVAAATSGGTGLGLYISKSLIDLMGGKIWAVSEGTNQGSIFTFSLPLATKEILAQAEKFTKKVEGEVKQLEPVAI